MILSFGVGVFILPFNLIIGGVSTVAIILDRIIDLDFITTDFLITVVTWALFFWGLFFLGKRFALKTLISTVVYPLGISFFSRLASPDIFDGFFCLANSRYSEISIILGAIFGGVLIGFGSALAFIGGGSTGGVDILAFSICKFFKKMRSSVAIFLIDGALILTGMFIIKDLAVTLLGITTAFLSAIVIDKIFLGESKAFIAQIVSEKYADINSAVAERLKRTTSIIDITGGYSGKKKKMLTVSFTIPQYNELINIINTTDKTAFVTIHRAHEINGEGWTW